MTEWTPDGRVALDAAKLTELALAIWRTNRRALRTEGATESVRIACESAMDCLTALDIRMDEMVGNVYHDSLRVNVVDQSGDLDLRISECLSPAIYIQGELTRPADVVVTGAERQDSKLGNM